MCLAAKTEIGDHKLADKFANKTRVTFKLKMQKQDQVDS